MEDTMLNDDAHVSAPPAHAQPPRGINHMVLNVRNLEVSHRFWTEIIGFRCVAELKPVPGRRRPKMRFYSRSEEHTSELQSRLHLVCRLLLEKKNPRRR